MLIGMVRFIHLILAVGLWSVSEEGRKEAP